MDRRLSKASEPTLEDTLRDRIRRAVSVDDELQREQEEDTDWDLDSLEDEPAD